MRDGRKSPAPLFQENGYFNAEGAINSGYPFIFVIGGRGTGKTINTIEYPITHGIEFMLMRRTQAQADLIGSPEFTPFNALDSIFGIKVSARPITKYNSGIYNVTENEKGEVKPSGSPLGFTCALSTISNIRGFDSSKTRLLIYDEFIPEKHERSIKSEGLAFLNAYETINRNRELNREKPLTAICLANANNIANPIFLELKLIEMADRAQRKNNSFITDEKRGVLLISLKDSPIIEHKRQTAISMVAREDGDYAGMAFNNDYVGDFTETKSKNLREYIPLVTIGEITIYQHKTGEHLYISLHRSGNVPFYDITELGVKKFNRKYFWTYQEYLNENIIFENRYCEAIFQTIVM